MELKGQNVERLGKEQKKKMRATLKEMKKNREKDDRYLRDILKEKLTWAVNEKQKGLNVIGQTNAQVLRLEGIIILLNEILNPKK